MHKAEVSIVLDSISPQGNRLTTFQLRYWRPIHSELMTHRVFSRNAGSSRARPSQAIINQVRNDPWGPLHWGINQPGMQAHQELSLAEQVEAKLWWSDNAQLAAQQAQKGVEGNLHKQIINRILEPYTFIDVVLSSTNFNNWDALRRHPDADPGIQDLAESMYWAREASSPDPLQPGEWHLPYIMGEDVVHVENHLMLGRIIRSMPSDNEKLDLLRKISVARCARVSYKAFDGKVAPIEKDLELYDKLIAGEPLHASPSEHQATPDVRGRFHHDGIDDWEQEHLHGNFDGWIQYRKTLPNEFVPG